jgi:hypothetical protein
MDELLIIISALDLHVNPVSVIASLVLADSESLAALRGPLMDNPEFVRRILLKKIAKNEFSLRFAVRLRRTVQVDINRLIEESGEFLGAARLDGLFYLANNIVLGINCTVLNESQEYKKC